MAVTRLRMELADRYRMLDRRGRAANDNVPNRARVRHTLALGAAQADGVESAGTGPLALLTFGASGPRSTARSPA